MSPHVTLDLSALASSLVVKNRPHARGYKLHVKPYSNYYCSYFNLLGIFQPVDQLSAVRQFISSSVTQQQHTFSLFALGKPLKDDSASLARLNLVSGLQSSASLLIGTT